MTTEQTPILEGYYKLAYEGYRNTSFSPERRARDIVDSYSKDLSEKIQIIKEKEGDTERYKDGYIRKFTAWLGAKSRCFSTMITGGSGINVRQHTKANEAEHKRSAEFHEWKEKIFDKITRPESTGIVKGSDGAIEKMEVKLRKLERKQEFMKACNKIARDKQGNKELRLMELGITEESAITILTPQDRGRIIGFQGFSLTINGAKIRNLKKDIESEKNRLMKYANGNKEYQIGVAKVIENVEENRLQLEFDGKPSDEIRGVLKKNGYRWSPKNGVWQRQLTNNALYCLRYIKPGLEAELV